MPIKTRVKPSRREQDIMNGQLSLFDLGSTLPLFQAIEPEPLPAIAVQGPELFTITTDDVLVRGARSKIEASIKAAQILYKVEAEDRPATDEEKRQMARYAAFGGLAKVFDERATDVASLYTQIKDTLTTEDYESARAASINAFYTDLDMIELMWRKVAALGFAGGRILEPAAAVGHFISGMPTEMRQRSQIAAVELDTLSGRIGQMIHEDVKYHVCGFQNAELPADYYDLAISNVPFGNFPVYDRSFKPSERSLMNSIHNYYFAKATKLVRPGGLIAFITSRYTMDSQTTEHREWMAANLTLIDAVRLPTGAFRAFSGTDVVTDILFFQKQPDPNPYWVRTVDIELPSAKSDRITEAFPINRFFIENADKVLGEYKARTGAYSATLAVINTDLTTLDDQADIALNNCTPVYTAVDPGQQITYIDLPESAIGLRDGAFYVTNEGTFRKKGLVAEAVKAKGRTLQNLQAQVALARQARIVVHLCLHGGDEQLAAAQEELNFLYDTYALTFGPINNPNNRRVFAGDPGSPLLRALEHYDPEKNTAQKTKIFSERTIRPHTIADHADNATDAMHLSINAKGKIDLAYMALICDQDMAQIIEELEDSIFYDQERTEWVTKDEYLSGNVKQKLDQAKANPATFPQNIKALEAVQPTPLVPEEIMASLGNTWIDAQYVQQFIIEMMDEKSTVNHLGEPEWPYRYNGQIGGYRWNSLIIKVDYVVALGRWLVDKSSSLAYNRQATEVWGTSRRNAIELVESVLNGSQIAIYDKLEDGTSVLNRVETVAAKEKAAKMQVAFRQWIWRDAGRAERLARVYNEKFNVYVRPQFDGSRLEIPGINPDVQLREHQKNVVARAIIGQDNLLMWHLVGSGKTMSMIVSAMERKRLGLSHKPMIVMPTHLLEQFAVEVVRLYPAVNMLVVDSTAMTPQDKSETLARIATNDWDMVLTNFSAFSRIPLKESTWQSIMTQQMDEIDRVLDQMKYTDNKTSKELEKAKKRLEAKMEARNDKIKHDHVGLTWEELGVDLLVADESHAFKSLFFSSARSHLPGIGGSESGMAYDMFIKSQWITRRCTEGHLIGSRSTCACGADRAPAGRLIFATGTAITNSICEMYTMQRFMQMDALIDAGIETFDGWASQFGDTETMLEMKPSGKGWRMNERFVRFHNVPELMGMALQSFDCKIDPDVLRLDRPDLKNGAPIPVEISLSDDIKAYLDTCAERADRLSRADRSDNMLKIMSDALKASTDMRLIDLACDDSADSKINTVVRNVYAIWKQTTNVMLADRDEPVNMTQVVFLDISTPKAEGVFSLYRDMKEKWIERGIPANEIVFAHEAETDAQKKAMYDRVNRGETRIIVGTTAKLGTGVNMQRLLYAIHHVDAPWTPALVEQREGRGLRQGNLNPEIAIYRYVVKGSLDFYKWHLLEVKSKFIRQLFTGANASQRTVADLDQAVIGFAQMKAIATGNPLVLEKVAIESELTKLYALQSKWISTKREYTYELSYKPENQQAEMRYIERLKAAKDTCDMYEGPRYQIDDTIYEERAEAAKRLADLLLKGEYDTIIQIGPAVVTLEVKRQKKVEGYGVFANVQIGKYTLTQVELSDSGTGSLSRMENILENLPDAIKKAEKRLAEVSDRIVWLKEIAHTPFEYADRLKELANKLNKIELELSAENTANTNSITAIADEDEDEDEDEDDQEIA